MDLTHSINFLGKEKTDGVYTSKDFVFFWKPLDKGGKTGTHVLTSWHNAPFKVNRVSFSCVEQYLTAEKALLFEDQVVYKLSLKKMHPKEYRELAGDILNFDETLWEKHRVDVVFQGNFAKFSQNKQLKEYLKNTKDKIIVKSSPYDAIWGIGLAKDHENAIKPELWQGGNLLGFVLMEVRAQLV